MLRNHCLCPRLPLRMYVIMRRLGFWTEQEQALQLQVAPEIVEFGGQIVAVRRGLTAADTRYHPSMLCYGGAIQSYVQAKGFDKVR